MLMDSCLYDWPAERKSLIERFAETHTLLASCGKDELPQSSV